MKLLMLGGTAFAGGATVAEALRRGWDVTVFNRGRQAPAPDGVRQITGDRTVGADLEALRGGEWDIVVDTWSGAPRATLAVARVLDGAIGHYVYVSSRSVYADPVALGADESAPVVEASADAEDGGYAELKMGSELAVEQVFGARATSARAGLLLGPGEDIGRLPWWLRRMERGGPTLAPGPRDLPLQYIDARDLAAFLLDIGTAGLGGAVNAVSPSGQTNMGELLDLCAEVTGGHADLRWTDPDPILAAGVVPWNDLPVWIPAGHEYRWLHEADVSRAVAAGLRCRPVRETVADTWTWLERVGEIPARYGGAMRPPIGLDPAVEAGILGL